VAVRLLRMEVESKRRFEILDASREACSST